MRRTALGIAIGSLPCLLLGAVLAQTPTAEKKLPPVDQAVPAKMETATLALG